MIVGIVAEYNPFHNGHKLQIDYAKNVLGATQVVVAMSGSFTQRGEIACFDKYTRAHTALVCGADIVLEIPTIFATASAREFASAGIQLLASTGVVDTLLFGAECDDIALFKDSAKKLCELENSGKLDKEITGNMSSGLNYATARSNALESHIPKELLDSPNNILGLEYCRYLYANNINMDIAIIKRSGNDYNETKISGEISSATAIRKNLYENGTLLSIPKPACKIFNNSTALCPDDVSQMLHYKLLSEDDFNRYLDCNKDLSDRINNCKQDYTSFFQFCDLLKSKNNTYSKISRVLCHILLDITYNDFNKCKESGYITYLRMLGFSKAGVSLLNDIKLKGSQPIITAPNEIINKSDVYSSDIYRAILTSKTGKVMPNEYTKKFDLIYL